MPQVLGAAGYDTAAIGKWHLGLEEENWPTNRGFGYFHGFLGDMMDDYYDHLRHGNHYMKENEKDVHPEGHATDIFTDWAVRYCGCRFCRAHRAVSWSDRHGRLDFWCRTARALERYRFGLKTADFYLCRACGVYVGACLERA